MRFGPQLGALGIGLFVIALGPHAEAQKKSRAAAAPQKAAESKSAAPPAESDAEAEAPAGSGESKVKAAGTAKGKGKDPKASKVTVVEETTKEEGVKTYKFSAIEVEGRLKSPQIVYFLRRVRAEFEAGALGHRSFMPELSDSRRSPELR